MKIRFILGVQIILVGLLITLIRAPRLPWGIPKPPLGIPGEWVWLSTHASASPLWFVLAAGAVFAYAAAVALGYRGLASRTGGHARETPWLAGLLAAAVAIQVLIPTGAAEEYDLTKWAYVNYFGASTGYYQVAKNEAVADPWRFLAEYPSWIQRQDVYHIGTHPPGLVVLQCILLRAMEAYPRVADKLVQFMPASTAAGFRQLERMERKTIPRADQAALFLSSLIILLACAGTVVPLYLLVRATSPAPLAWAAAALWPLVPSANLFQPDADTAYPFLATTALALAAWAVRLAANRRGASLLLALLSGMTLAFGLWFTMAFLPVGLIVAILIMCSRPVPIERTLVILLAVGIGFLALMATGWAVTRANPVTIGVWNLRKHAEFYVHNPRTYLTWLLVNPIELAIALGLPAAVWCLIGLARPRSIPAPALATIAVLVLLNLVGRNLGEVARLWILFMPPLLIAAGAGMTRLGGGYLTLGISCALVGLQTLALQAMIQVVYPV
jgi:hypothetical protein